MSQKLDRAKEIRRMLIETWWQDHAGWVDEQAARQGFGEADAAAFRAQVSGMVVDKAWMAAQHQAAGRAAHVVFSRGDLDSAIDRTISQRPKLVTAKPLVSQPRHVHRTMDERLASVGLGE